MAWVRVRLLVNCWRGLAGDVVLVPASVAGLLVLRHHATWLPLANNAA